MLSQELLSELRVKLEDERDNLTKQLERLGDRTRVKGETDFDAKHVELGDDIEENALESADDAARDEQVIHLEKRLKDVLDALKRMDAGNYGSDESSGAEISEERLKANPAARTA